ncbi:serine/threonine-protein kinase [Streptomyces sp. NPDC088794]|uniref:serine/threonine-protein kinase n=1 Tax=Streptomyces sp. NPDC088794 TaxID=3365902 RepID=UPI0037F71487
MRWPARGCRDPAGTPPEKLGASVISVFYASGRWQQDVFSGTPPEPGDAHDNTTTDETMLARFHREARIGMQMRHPNITHTIQFVESPEHALIMELIEGRQLADYLNEVGVLSPAETAHIGKDLGEALRYMDSVGLYRIDIKPSNVVLHPTRGAVIVDLGLARALEESGRELTQIGVLIGTPSYMAPEQVIDGGGDIRADLFALGMVLYRCLVGRSPYESSSAVASLHRLITEDISVDGPAGSPALRNVLSRCLTRDPELRYQKPQDFLVELEATPEFWEEPRLMPDAG